MEKSKQSGEILESLDNIKRAVPEPFFYTRLRARMEGESMQVMAKPRLLRPAWAIAMLTIVLFINGVIIFGIGNKGSGSDNLAAESEKLQTIAADYNMNDVSSLYDLNEER